MPEYDDEMLDQIMREGLELRAGSAATQLADPPGSQRSVVRRGRRRWAAGAAAAAVVVAGGVTFAALPGSGSDEGQVAVDTGQVPSDWRYESYDGVQVRVPPTWAWGGEPVRTGDTSTVCGDQTATVGPNVDGFPVTAATPYVGRPVMMSDACTATEGPPPEPGTDAVWLGSPLPVGTHAAGSLTVQTVAVGSQHVTVFAGNETLRAEILSTAEAVEVDGNGCPTTPVREPAPGPTDDPSPSSLSVCAYASGTLLWSGRSDDHEAQDYVDAFSRASATFDAASLCSSRPAGQWVAIGVGYGDAPTRWDIANFDVDCSRLVGTYTYGDAGKQSQTEAPLTPDTVAPWALGGIKAYVAGPIDLGSPPDEQLRSYFRGMLG